MSAVVLYRGKFRIYATICYKRICRSLLLLLILQLYKVLFYKRVCVLIKLQKREREVLTKLTKYKIEISYINNIRFYYFTKS